MTAHRQHRPRPAAGPALQPDRQAPAGRRRADGLQRAHHHPRPDERPASHDAGGDHRRLRQALGLGPVGRRPLGAQPARRGPGDHHRPPPEGGRRRDRAGPGAAGRVLSRRPRSGRAQHPVRGPVHPDRRRRRSRPIRWRRPRAAASSSSSHWAEDPSRLPSPPGAENGDATARSVSSHHDPCKVGCCCCRRKGWTSRASFWARRASRRSCSRR